MKKIGSPIFSVICIFLAALLTVSACGNMSVSAHGLMRGEGKSGAGTGAGTDGKSGIGTVSYDKNSDSEEQTAALIRLYEEYQENFAELEKLEELPEHGYDIIEEQVFPVMLESFGEGEIMFVPAMERQYQRLALFLTDAEGNIVYKYNQLEANMCIQGQMKQPVQGIAAVSFQDVNGDGLLDIVLITTCRNETGDYAGKVYKVGDVLFQGKRSFFRDWRISDKINRFSMNKSIDFIISFVRDGYSTEFLYTAVTLEELLDNGFEIIEEQCYWRRFEKQGRLQVVPGTYRMADYDIFMIYLVNEQGYIVWSFQPMGDYDNLYSLKGMTGKDVDGDGMKDLVVLARYSREGDPGELIVDSECAIYYQRTSGFDVDMEFREHYQCTDEDTLEGLVEKIREYWGW